jgi:hypothetical protein
MTRKTRQESPEDVQARVWHRLTTEGVETAYEALVGACRDPKGTAQSKATAGRTLFEAAGFLGKAHERRQPEIFEMAGEQLAAAIADLGALKGHRAARAAGDGDEGIFE